MTDPRGPDPRGIEAAAKRLSAALDSLEALLERRHSRNSGDNALSAQIQTLGLDRARLASALDREAARNKRLEDAARDAGRRVEKAINVIETVMSKP